MQYAFVVKFLVAIGVEKAYQIIETTGQSDI
jgi:hypothetical protein